jgi:hypothetical protein
MEIVNIEKSFTNLEKNISIEDSKKIFYGKFNKVLSGVVVPIETGYASKL